MDLSKRTFDPLLEAIVGLAYKQVQQIEKEDVIDFLKQSLILFESGDIYFRRLWAVVETWWAYCKKRMVTLPDFMFSISADERQFVPFDEIDFLRDRYAVQKAVLKFVIHDPVEIDKIIRGWNMEYDIENIVEKEKDKLADSLIENFRIMFSSSSKYPFVLMLFSVFRYAIFLSAIGYGHEEIIGMLED